MDTTNDELFVVNNASDIVNVYSSTATDDPPPKRSFSNSMNYPYGIYVANNEMFVSNFNNTVTVYPATATDNPAPIRTLGGPNTGLSGIYSLYIADLAISVPNLQVNNTLRGVELSWQDDSDFQAHGFHVWRKEPNEVDSTTGKIIDNPYIKITNLAIISGQGSYTYTDAYAELGKSYSYKIEYISDTESRFGKIVTITAKQ